MSEESYGLAALQFFCFPDAAQVASWRKVAQQPLPHFFSEKTEADYGCDYFIGVACVFMTYASDVYDRFLSSDECEHLIEFHERLNAFMFQPAEYWSESAVLDDKDSLRAQNWRRLREDAKKALDELGETLSNEPSTFVIGELISPDEFITSDEARRLLE